MVFATFSRFDVIGFGVSWYANLAEMGKKQTPAEFSANIDSFCAPRIVPRAIRMKVTYGFQVRSVLMESGRPAGEELLKGVDKSLEAGHYAILIYRHHCDYIIQDSVPLSFRRRQYQEFLKSDDRRDAERASKGEPDLSRFGISNASLLTLPFPFYATEGEHIQFWTRENLVKILSVRDEAGVAYVEDDSQIK